MRTNYSIPKTKLIRKLRRLKNWVHTFLTYLILFLTVIEKFKNIFGF